MPRSSLGSPLPLTNLPASSYAAGFQSRETVLVLMPNCSAISARVLPAARMSAILCRFAIIRGRPPIRPCRRARAKPAVTRSEIRTRSCAAMVASIESTASRKIPQLSRYCSVKLRHPHAVGREPLEVLERY